MTDKPNHLLQRPLSRSEYLQIIRTGLAVRQFSFARQAALNWLATYPGDLQAGLYYAQALTGERHLSRAVQVLHGLCYADPEFREAVETFLDVVMRIKEEGEVSGSGSESSPAQVEAIEGMVRAHWFALNGAGPQGERSASWGGPLWFARQALEQGDLRLAGDLIQEVLGQQPVHPLAGIIHLRILGNDASLSQDARYTIVRSYHQRWPDTLEILLRMADWSLERGQSDQAVALLHQSAARDVSGQVVQRLWGKDHPFRSLWPERLERKLNLMMPAVVAARLGWNRLPAGDGPDAPPPEETPAGQAAAAGPALTPVQLEPEGAGAQGTPKKTPAPEDGFPFPSRRKPFAVQNEAPAQAAPGPERSKRSSKATESEMRAVEQEIEKLAARFKVAGLTRQDGRFPVYVIFSLRSRLQSVYGPEAASLIENEMRLLAEAINCRPGWGAQVFFADDPSCTLPLGSKPVKPDDPWGLKLALADLDKGLARQGERIGAVLIVGGPEIVPFHLLPNPVDDQDHDVPSDNPYATRDKNYFIPEWPVGRLPGGSGNDARLLLKTLRCYQAEHAAQRRKLPLRQRFSYWAARLWKNLQLMNRLNFGYSAEIWRRAARSVFRPIGRPGRMHISPPSGAPQQNAGAAVRQESSLQGVPTPVGKLGYFNLHGLVDASEWFGHRDASRTSHAPDYPVALRPEDIRPETSKGRVPRVVFSEACYGMHIQGRALDEAISLKFLEAGTLAIAGSTSMAYGSMDANPMMAADLLGYTFWRFLKSGMPAGEAIRQAKIYLVSEMNRRQGYLDGEDQKTLISFILYGDPLAEPLRNERVPVSVRYQMKPLADVRAVCDRPDLSDEAGPVPVEVMDGVRQVVAKYLPGMSDARLAYVCEHGPQEADGDGDCSEAGHGAAQPGRENIDPTGKSKNAAVSFRNLVTLSKQVARRGEVHPEIARLTLDEDGNLVKLVVSR